MSAPRETDVVLIGLGAAGGVAVGPLTAAGLRVVALEAGPRHTRAEFFPDEIANDVRNWLGDAKVNHEIPTWRAEPGDEAAVPGFRALMSNGVGGSAQHSPAQYFRLLPWHFRERSAIVERYGEAFLPEGSSVVDWPFGYDELEPYYARVEELLGVSGKAGNIAGRLDTAGNVFEGPRSTEFPLPPLRRTGWTEYMAGVARDIGWHPYPVAAGIRSQPYKGLNPCTYCGFCAFGGCHADARGTTALRGIPEAEATGNLDVVTGARVVRIETRSDGRATGVTYVKDGEERFLAAKVVLLATFAYENSRLLLLSRGDAHPAGIGNARDQVGRYFMTHNIVFGTGLFPGQQLNLMSGSSSQGTAVDDWEGDNFDHREHGFVGGSTIQTMMELEPIALARGTPPSVPRWGSAWKGWLKEHANSIGLGLLQIEQLPYENYRLDLDPKATDPLGLPVVRTTMNFGENERNAFAFLTGKLEEWFRAAGATEMWFTPLAPLAVSSHAYGGTRMGEDPETSVVDPWSFVHDAPNLGVLGASAMPVTAGRNPSLTVQAMAWRTADRLVAEWDRIAG